MIQFDYKNRENVSLERIKEAEDNFIEKLGPFKEEFDSKNGYVQINFDNELEGVRGRL